MFIGREIELKFLENKYQAVGGQLVVLYGRRRIGKTELLREFCKNKDHVFYSCIEYTDHQQLLAFSESILKKNIPASKYLKRFDNWESAFSSVTELPGTSKKLLVIDEFPYICKGNNSIPSILQNLWDISLKNENIMIVLCGSSMSFIEKELLAEKNPLYGRATGIYKMNEMPFSDVIKFFPNYNFIDKLTAYAVLGGIPHYLQQFDPELPIEKNIQKNILTKGSVLYSEVEFLLRQELRETAVYNTIIEAIALRNTKLNDIYAKTLIEKSKLSSYLKNLIDLQIVEREFSISDGIKEQTNSSRGLYRLTDKFFRFWYGFVFSNYSDLESGDVSGVFKYVVQPKLHEFISFVFEDICMEYIKTKNRRNELPHRYSKIGRWWGKITKSEDNDSKKKTIRTIETEIDIMGTDQNNKNYLLGECKYRKKAFDMQDYKNLIEKHLQDKNINYVYYLFSLSGFTDSVKSMEDQGNVVCVTIEDIIKYL